jgi:Domain of unknown function (DUF1902)
MEGFFMSKRPKNITQKPPAPPVPFRISITQQDDGTDAEWSARHEDVIVSEADTLEALRAKLPDVVRDLGGDPANFHVLTFRFSTPDDEMYREGPQGYNPHWARPFRPSTRKPG